MGRAAEGPWGPRCHPPGRPRPPEAHLALKLQGPSAGRRVPPGPLQRLLPGEGDPAPLVAGVLVTAKRLLRGASSGRGMLLAGADLRRLQGCPWPACSPELRTLGLATEGLAQQAPQAGQVHSSRDPQGQGEGTLHSDGHQGRRFLHGRSLGQSSKAVVAHEAPALHAQGPAGVAFEPRGWEGLGSPGPSLWAPNP